MNDIIQVTHYLQRPGTKYSIPIHFGIWIAEVRYIENITFVCSLCMN